MRRVSATRAQPNRGGALQSGVWATSASHHSSCNGESAALAFRVCRRSCGFCRPDLYREDVEETERRCVTLRPRPTPSTSTLAPFSLITEPDMNSYLSAVVDE